MMSPSLYATSLLARDAVISVKYKKSETTARKAIGVSNSSFKGNQQSGRCTVRVWMIPCFLDVSSVEKLFLTPGQIKDDIAIFVLVILRCFVFHNTCDKSLYCKLSLPINGNELPRR